MKCVSCGNAISDGARFCASCGASLGPASLPCRVCGKAPAPGDAFCQKCGSNLAPRDERAGDPAPSYPLGATCLRCGQSSPWGAPRCSRCGKRMGDGYDYSPFAGALMIAGAVFSTLFFLNFIMVLGSGASYGASGLFFTGGIAYIISTVGFGAIACLGGIYAVRHQHFFFVVIAALFSILSAGIFGIIALMLLLFSKDYFKS